MISGEQYESIEREMQGKERPSYIPKCCWDCMHLDVCKKIEDLQAVNETFDGLRFGKVADITLDGYLTDHRFQLQVRCMDHQPKKAQVAYR